MKNIVHKCYIFFLVSSNNPHNFFRDLTDYRYRSRFKTVKEHFRTSVQLDKNKALTEALS